MNLFMKDFTKSTTRAIPSPDLLKLPLKETLSDKEMQQMFDSMIDPETPSYIKEQMKKGMKDNIAITLAAYIWHQYGRPLFFFNSDIPMNAAGMYQNHDDTIHVTDERNLDKANMIRHDFFSHEMLHKITAMAANKGHPENNPACQPAIDHINSRYAELDPDILHRMVNMFLGNCDNMFEVSENYVYVRSYIYDFFDSVHKNMHPSRYDQKLSPEEYKRINVEQYRDIIEACKLLPTWEPALKKFGTEFQAAYNTIGVLKNAMQGYDARLNTLMYPQSNQPTNPEMQRLSSLVIGKHYYDPSANQEITQLMAPLSPLINALQKTYSSDPKYKTTPKEPLGTFFSEQSGKYIIDAFNQATSPQYYNLLSESSKLRYNTENTAQLPDILERRMIRNENFKFQTLAPKVKYVTIEDNAKANELPTGNRMRSNYDPKTETFTIYQGDLESPGFMKKVNEWLSWHRSIKTAQVDNRYSRLYQSDIEKAINDLETIYKRSLGKIDDKTDLLTLEYINRVLDAGAAEFGFTDLQNDSVKHYVQEQLTSIKNYKENPKDMAKAVEILVSANMPLVLSLEELYDQTGALRLTNALRKNNTATIGKTRQDIFSLASTFNPDIEARNIILSHTSEHLREHVKSFLDSRYSTLVDRIELADECLKYGIQVPEYPFFITSEDFGLKVPNLKNPNQREEKTLKQLAKLMEVKPERTELKKRDLSAMDLTDYKTLYQLFNHNAFSNKAIHKIISEIHNQKGDQGLKDYIEIGKRMGGFNHTSDIFTLENGGNKKIILNQENPEIGYAKAVQLLFEQYTKYPQDMNAACENSEKKQECKKEFINKKVKLMEPQMATREGKIVSSSTQADQDYLKKYQEACTNSTIGEPVRGNYVIEDIIKKCYTSMPYHNVTIVNAEAEYWVMDPSRGRVAQYASPQSLLRGEMEYSFTPEDVERLIHNDIKFKDAFYELLEQNLVPTMYQGVGQGAVNSSGVNSLSSGINSLSNNSSKVDVMQNNIASETVHQDIGQGAGNSFKDSALEINLNQNKTVASAVLPSENSAISFLNASHVSQTAPQFINPESMPVDENLVTSIISNAGKSALEGVKYGVASAAQSTLHYTTLFQFLPERERTVLSLISKLINQGFNAQNALSYTDYAMYAISKILVKCKPDIDQDTLKKATKAISLGVNTYLLSTSLGLTGGVMAMATMEKCGQYLSPVIDKIEEYVLRANPEQVGEAAVDASKTICETAANALNASSPFQYTKPPKPASHTAELAYDAIANISNIAVQAFQNVITWKRESSSASNITPKIVETAVENAINNPPSARSL